MARAKGVSDEQIIAAIVSSGTIAEAAEKCGITPRTIYDRMKSADFRAEYMHAKADIVRAAVNNMNNHLAAAVDTVAEIMSNPENNPAVRLQAAQTILNNAGKFSDRLTDADNRARKENQSMEDVLQEALFGS